MSLYDRVSTMPQGRRALAEARLRRSVLVALHRAFRASRLQSQTELAKRLHVRRSAVNQVFRGDGNIRVNTLAEYLYEMGFEAHLTLVAAGEMREAELEGRPPRPAFNAAGSATTAYTMGNVPGLWSMTALLMPSSALSVSYMGCSVQSSFRLLSGSAIWNIPDSAPLAVKPINLSRGSIGAVS